MPSVALICHLFSVRERDELMEHVTSLKSNVQKLAQREEEAYQQTKMGIEMVEQAQLEQTQVKFTVAKFLISCSSL